MDIFNLDNKDFSNLRKVVESLALDLTLKVYYYNYYFDTTTNEKKLDKIFVPFYYNLGGGEGFMFDHFISGKISCPDDVLTKICNYEIIPRGILNVASIAIESEGLTNKFNRGNIQKLDENNILKEFNIQYQMVPLVMTINTTIICTDILNCFKITEKIIELLYKNQYKDITLGNILTGTYTISYAYKLPENYNMETSIEYTFDDKKMYRLTFDIEVRVMYPVFEDNTIIFNGKRMQIIENNVYNLIKINEDVKNKPDIGKKDSIWSTDTNF